jgi:hypothetical protein
MSIHLPAVGFDAVEVVVFGAFEASQLRLKNSQRPLSGCGPCSHVEARWASATARLPLAVVLTAAPARPLAWSVVAASPMSRLHRTSQNGAELVHKHTPPSIP